MLATRRAHSLASAGICLGWLVWLTLGLSPIGWAAPPDNWEVLRVFIRDDPEQINRLVTSQYATVLLDDLARELAEHSNRRKVSPLKTAALEEAIYVARLEAESLQSDQSRWKLSGPESSQPIELGNVSLALRAARGVPSGELQLADRVQFSASGGVELPLTAEDRVYWFGFSTASQERGGERVFILRLPPAVNSKLLLSTPSNIKLNSPTVVVEKIPSLANQLPEDWSVSSLPSTTTASQWWLLHLSGVSEFELTASQNGDQSLTWYQHLVRTAVIDYVGDDRRTEVRAQFVVAGEQSAMPLRLTADSDFKIETVLVDGLPVPWRVEPGLSSDSTLIEMLDLTNSAQDRRIEVRATCPPQVSGLAKLPQIAVAESYTMDGKSRLSGSNGWVADRMLAAGHLASRGTREQTTVGPPVNDAQMERLVWETTWLGTPPELKAQFSRQRLPARARSLTRLSVQAEWLNANCRIRVDSPAVHSNEIRLPVGNGWFIDSVRLIGAESDVGVRVEDRESAASSLIVVHWEGSRREIDFELEVIGHSPRESNAEVISLLSPRLVTLPQGDQIDNYAVEHSSRFAVQVGAELLPYQRQSFELPVWQQELLKPATETWVFQGARGSIPPINLTAASGTYSSQVWSVVRLLPNGLAALRTQIHCTPTAGSIDRIRLAVPAGVALDDWLWTLQDTAEIEENVKLNAIPVADTLAEGTADEQAEQIVELELPGPMTNAFTLACDLPLEASRGSTEDLKIPVIGLAAASRGESTLLIPRQLASGLEQLPAEVLITAALPKAPEWVELADPTFTDDSSRWIAARMDASGSQLLQLLRPRQELPAGWVWSELIEHSIQDNGQIDHELQWVIEGRGGEPLEVTLPAGWQVERIHVNGILVDSPQLAQSLKLEMPGEGRTVVSMRCVSRQKPPRWLSFYPMQRPELSLPVLAERATLAIPPTRLAARRLPHHWMSSDAALRLVDRLLPTTLWRLLAPTRAEADSSFAAPDLPAGWSSIELADETSVPSAYDLLAGRSATAQPGEWILSRSALSAIALALVLMMACALWVVLGPSPRRWWLVATLCVIAVVLVPSWLLAPTQLVLLALCLAALLRLCVVVNSWRNGSRWLQGRSSVLHRGAPLNTTALLLCCLVGSAAGQSSTENAGPTAMSVGNGYGSLASDSQSPPRPEIFGVLIPIDDAGEVAGGYAYAPTRLLELLAGDGDWSSLPVGPKILSADYTLRLRRGLASGPDQVQELSVEFRLQVAQADVELRLPFKNSQLQLQRGSVGGQELFVGGRWLSQLADAVVYRASSSGTQRLQLQFEPRNLAVDENVANLQCTIPPIPNATLRIVADSSSNFEIGSSGSGRKTVSSVSTEVLGPVPELSIQWSPATQRNNTGTQIAGDVFADTWLHARGEQISAICQLRIENAATLPRDLHIVAEPGWEPVGTHWEDGELASSELSTMGGRRVYTIRSYENWEQASRRVLRVLMVPRDPEQISALAIPFFSLREVSQQTVTRTLAWTTEEGAAWRPDGLELWQELSSVPGLEWGELAWNARPKLYRLMGMLATALRRATPPPSATIDEMTQVHLTREEVRLNYRGQFSTPQQLPRTLVIPRGARVDSLLVDGSSRDYRISERDEQAIIEILGGDKQTTHRSVEVALSQPLKLEEPSRFPRVFIRDFEASRSIYRVLCGLGLNCTTAPHETISLSTANIPAHELLPALETPLGQVDLGPDYRDQSFLPLEFNVQRRAEVPLESAVMAFKRSEQGWRAVVTAVWRTGIKPLDFAFFELPVAVRDSVDTGQLPAQLTPLGESGRMTLRLLPAPPVAGKTKVEFSFALPAAVSTQTVSLPKVAILSEMPQTPLLALPTQIDGQTIQWSGVGRQVDEAPSAFAHQDGENSYQLFEIEPARSQVSWKRFEDETRNASLLLSHLTLVSQQQNQLAGYVDYWIAPLGQLKLALEIPEQCRVLGVEIAEQPAIWSQHKEQLQIVLQPNYLPLNVRILLHWKVSQQDSLALTLPRIKNAIAAEQALQFVENRLPDFRAKPAATSDSQQRILQEFSHQWVRLLLETLQGSRTRPAGETLTWLKHWQPQRVGLSEQADVDAEQFSELAVALDADEFADWSGRSTDDLWRYAWQIAEDQQTPATDATTDGAASDTGMLGSPPALIDWPATSPGQRFRLTPQQQVVVLTKVLTTSSWTSRWLAAGLLTITSLLVFFLANRFSGRYFQLLTIQPWVYWLQLAVIAWWLLPIAWPSWVLALTAAGMLISQWLETRRRQRLLARV